MAFKFLDYPWQNMRNREVQGRIGANQAVRVGGESTGIFGYLFIIVEDFAENEEVLLAKQFCLWSFYRVVRWVGPFAPRIPGSDYDLSVTRNWLPVS